MRSMPSAAEMAPAVFLALVTPICGWVIFTDLKYMKIRNAAVLALIAVFALAGPLVLPGQSPCLACVELHRVDADPLIAVLAAQIIRATPAAETLACAELAASLALIALRQWQTEESPDTAVRLRFPVRGGRPRYAPTTEDVLPHPECGCSLFQDAL